jgi:hypothetical protein
MEDMALTRAMDEGLGSESIEREDVLFQCSQT